MSKDLLDKLSAPFDVKEVKQRTQGGRQLDYISIDATIRRFNEVLGTTWSTQDLSVTVTPVGDKHLAVVSLTLVALGKLAVGVGADQDKDVDKALKTALAEALKKAGHQFGVGLYLWDAEEREVLAAQRGAEAGDINSLKQLVVRKVIEGKGTPTREGIAEFFGIKEAGLDDPEILRELLAR